MISSKYKYSIYTFRKKNFLKRCLMSFHFCLEMSNQTSVTETKILAKLPKLVKLVSPQVRTMKELSFDFWLYRKRYLCVNNIKPKTSNSQQRQKYYIKSISRRKTKYF